MNGSDTSVFGEDDRWMVFWRSTPDGYPLSVSVRMNNPHIQDLVNRGILTGFRFDLTVEHTRDDGMPSDVGQLQDFEVRLLKEVELLDVGACHVASVTGDGGRWTYLGHERPIDFGPLASLFQEHGVQASASVVSDREALIGLISPTSVEQQLNDDIGVISNLEKEGDDGRAPRRTDFWFYGDRSRLDEFAAELAPRRYAIDRRLDDPEGIVLYSETAVDFGTFQEITPVLVGAAERHSVIYDGWETFVVRPNSPAPDLPAKPKSQSLLSKLFGAKKN